SEDRFDHPALDHRLCPHPARSQSIHGRRPIRRLCRGAAGATALCRARSGFFRLQQILFGAPQTRCRILHRSMRALSDRTAIPALMHSLAVALFATVCLSTPLAAQDPKPMSFCAYQPLLDDLIGEYTMT